MISLAAICLRKRTTDPDEPNTLPAHNRQACAELVSILAVEKAQCRGPAPAQPDACLRPSHWWVARLIWEMRTTSRTPAASAAANHPGGAHVVGNTRQRIRFHQGTKVDAWNTVRTP